MLTSSMIVLMYLGETFSASMSNAMTFPSFSI